VCGADLVYKQEHSLHKCFYCGEEFNTNVVCQNNHYICDNCHKKTGVEVIKVFCESSELTNPIQIAEILMKNPKIHMHGPEHHYLVPAALITAYYNLKNEPQTKKMKLLIAEKRASKILGGFCGYYGTCGAAVGTGIFLSIILDATPLKKEEWRLANHITGETLLKIADHGGPRCCKRNTFLAISEAVKFIEKKLNVKIPVKEDLKCSFNHLNAECIGENCPFFSVVSSS